MPTALKHGPQLSLLSRQGCICFGLISFNLAWAVQLAVPCYLWLWVLLSVIFKYGAPFFFSPSYLRPPRLACFVFTKVKGVMSWRSARWFHRRLGLGNGHLRWACYSAATRASSLLPHAFPWSENPKVRTYLLTVFFLFLCVMLFACFLIGFFLILDL